MKLRAPRLLVVIPVLAIGAVVCLLAHDVSTEVTPDDRKYAGLILTQAGYDPAKLEPADVADFESEVRTIVAVQDAVLTVGPEDRGIPLGVEREPKDFFEHKYGLCYDRSRVMEKMLSWLGFKMRHVSVYSTVGSSVVTALLVPKGQSHAVSEVLTEKGWMLIDSNARWIGLDSGRDAISLDEIQADKVRTWAPESRDPINKIFVGPFVQIRGLYSRHGYFYPPFTPIPDYNSGQLLSNLFD